MRSREAWGTRGGAGTLGPARRGAPPARHLTDNAERGGALFAPTCSSCHGLTGKGALERPGLPGAPLNLEENRPTTIGELTVLHRKFMDTIACGRGGTLS